MLRHKSYLGYCLTVPIILFLLILTISCSHQPAGPGENPGDSSGFTGKGRVDPGKDSSYLLGTASDTLFALGRIEVWAMDVAYDSAAGIVSFDAMLINATDRPIAPAIRFVITWISPPDISVVDFDGISDDGFPFFDFSYKLGPDSILGPGERTEQVTMRFHTARPRSFGIGFRIDMGLTPGTGTIAGVVFMDRNKNGLRDRCERCVEPGIHGITVTLSTMGDGPGIVLIGRTNAKGEFAFWDLCEGLYKLRVYPPDESWDVTSPNPLIVTLIEGPNGGVKDFLEANFGLFHEDLPMERTLFGPVVVGPRTPHGILLDSIFVDPPSMLPVVFTYYLEAVLPPIEGSFPVIVDSASAWINGVQVFDFSSAVPSDTMFVGELIELPEGLVHPGENDIRLYADENELAVVQYRVFRKPF